MKITDNGIKKLMSIQKLKIVNNPNITGKGFKNLDLEYLCMCMCKNFINLEYLSNIKEIILTGYGMIKDSNFIYLSNVEKLTISSLTDKSISYLKNIKFLHITSKCDLSDLGIIYLQDRYMDTFRTYITKITYDGAILYLKNIKHVCITNVYVRNL
jgi:hypothetical protein